MVGKAKTQLTLSKALLAIGAFLIPLLGGQISTDQALPLNQGIGPLLVSMLGGPFTQGFETPLLSHFVIGLLFAASLAISLIQRSVVQLPSIRLMALLMAFFGILALSVGLTEFRFVSIAAIGEWLLYALALFTAVAVCGRQDGPRLILTAFYIGVAVLALYGVGFEYRDMRAIDPGYRIFIGWVNPNATAGVLILGFMIGLGLFSTADRTVKLLMAVGNALIGMAMFLTGSKAGFGALLAGAFIWSILALIWQRDMRSRMTGIGAALVSIVLAFVLYTGIQRANRPATDINTSALGRVTAFNESQAQSLEFRKLLWKGSLDTALKHPTGYGVGTYRYESSRPGLTTQTQLAHNNLLQLAVESSLLAPILFVGALFVWLGLMFRGAKSMTQESNAMRAAIVSAVLATIAHGIFESNLYYFGIGMATFLLMGIGVNLSADSVVPEFTPRGVRIGLAFLAATPLILVFFTGYAEYQRALIRGAISSGDGSLARDIAAGLVQMAPLDGEAWNYLHYLDPQRRTEAIKRAATESPSPRILRNLAKIYVQQGKYSSAEAALTTALTRDPNNFNTLADAQESAVKAGDERRAIHYAERIVAVEKTPYYQIRSLPQMVETATADARVFLASHATELDQRVDLLSGAVDIYRQYVQVTIPEILRFTRQGMDYAGQTKETAIAACEKGLNAIKQLEKLLREKGDTARADLVHSEAAAFDGALASLRESK